MTMPGLGLAGVPGSSENTYYAPSTSLEIKFGESMLTPGCQGA